MRLLDLTLNARSALLTTYARFRLRNGFDHVAPWLNLVPITLTSAYGESLSSTDALALARRCLIYRMLIKLDHDDLERGGRVHELVNTGPLLETYARGRGVVVCSMHLGPYYYVGLELGGLGLTTTTVAADGIRDEKGIRWSRALAKMPGPVETLPARGAPTLIRMLRALKRGNAVAVYMDGQTGVGGPAAGQHHSVVIPMLGMEMRLRAGPAFLAQKAQAPVVLAVAHRTPAGRRVIEFSDVFDPPAGDDHEARAELMHRMAPWFEERVRRHPEQWGGWFVPVLTWAETGTAPAVSRESFDREFERVRALVADTGGQARLTADRARVAVYEHLGEQVIVEATKKRILAATPLGCGVLRAAFRGVRMNRLPRLFPDGADALSLEVTRMVLAGLARIEGDARA